MFDEWKPRGLSNLRRFVYLTSVFSALELRTFAAIREPATVSELATVLNRSQAYVSATVERLESEGLLRTTREDDSTNVARADLEALEGFVELVERTPHVPFARLLAGNTLLVLSFLDTPTPTSQLVEKTGLDKVRVHAVLRPLLVRGIVYQDGGTYALDEGFEAVSTVADELLALRDEPPNESLFRKPSEH